MTLPLSELRRSLNVKKGVKQNLLILRPLWHCSEGNKQLVKGSFLVRGIHTPQDEPRPKVRPNSLSCKFVVRFWLPKNEHIFSPYKQWVPHQNLPSTEFGVRDEDMQC